MSQREGRLPNVFLVGAQRCATSSLFHYLKLHPEVHTCDPKEPRYFSHRGVQPDFRGPGDAERVNAATVWDEIAYRQLFADVNADQQCLEATTTYLHDAEALQAIRESVPDARILIMLRNPIERAVSCWRYKTNQGLETLSFAEALDEEAARIENRWAPIWHYVERGRYAAAIERCFDLFGRERVEVINYEQFAVEPAVVLERVRATLALSSPFPVTSGVYDNAASKAGRRKPGLFGRIERRMRRILSPTPKPRPIAASSSADIGSECHARLVNAFAADVEKTGRLLGWSISHWMQPELIAN